MAIKNSKFNFLINLLLTAIIFALGWYFTSKFYLSDLAIWLTSNSGNTFIGDWLNPFPTIVEMMIKAISALFLVLGISFFLYGHIQDDVNKISWLLSILTKGALKSVQFFTVFLISGCAYIVQKWEEIYPLHAIFHAEDIAGFKRVLCLLIGFWIVCVIIKYASKIKFKEIGADRNKFETCLQNILERFWQEISYFCFFVAMLIVLLMPVYELFDSVQLLIEACQKDTKLPCDLPDLFSNL